MPAFSAETAYEFRHATLRDAAYQLHLPSDRQLLHMAAFEYLHETLSEVDRAPIASELLAHLRSGAPVPMPTELAKLELYYVEAAARRALDTWQGEEELKLLGQLRELPAASPAAKLDAVQRIASLLLRFGRGVEAAEQLENARASVTEPGGNVEAGLLSGLGGIYMQSGRAGEAAPILDRAIEIQKTTGDERALARALTHRAILMRHSGSGEPLELLEQALEINQRLNLELGTAKTLTALGGYHRHYDQHERALDCYSQALEIFQHNGARIDEAQCLGNLANVYLQLDRLDEAENRYLQSLRTLRELGHRRSEALTLGNLGQLLWLRGRLGQCVAAQHEAARIFEQINDTLLLPAFLAMLAGKYTSLGRLEDSARTLERARQLADSQEYAIATVDYVLPSLLSLHMTRCVGAYGKNADPPDRSALADAEDVYRHMTELSKKAPKATVVMGRTMGRMLKKVLAARAAVNDGQPAGIFNGLTLEEDSRELRKALLCRLAELAPESLQRLKESDPTLYTQMTDGLDDIPEPDWRSETLPM